MNPDNAPELGSPTVSKEAPESLALRAQPRPVTRLNRRVLVALAGGMSAAVLGATMWSLQAPGHRNMAEPMALDDADRVSRSPALDQLPADYASLPATDVGRDDVPQLGPPLPGDLGPAIVKAQPSFVVGDPPPGQDPAIAERDALQKEAETAATSPVFFRSGTQRSTVGSEPPVAIPSPTTPALTPTPEPRLAAAFDPQAPGLASTAAQPTDPVTAQNRQDQKEMFQQAGVTATHNVGLLQSPMSPYQVMAGTVIAAALVTGVRSDLPGEVIGTVTEPVYDTATGRHLLIPQGARMIGRYNSQLSYGQNRVQMVWQRIILPDTSSLTLDNLIGADPAGYAGLEDGIERHWGRIFAGAALTTLLGVAAELAAPENRNGNRVIIAGRSGLQSSVNQAGQELTRRSLNIQPTLTARPGLPVRIIVNRDLVLRPYSPIILKRGVSS
nr:TrbI/VirB10 family protein [uncultured Cupriavidus sp.]